MKWNAACLVGQWVSMIAFSIFGIGCFATQRAVAEFERLGVPELRLLTGVLQVLGAFGLAAGFWRPMATVAAAAGLALLMAGGLIVRIRVGDPVLLMLPALGMLLLNLFVCLHVYRGSHTLVDETS